MMFIVNWLIASFLNGAFFFGLFVLLLYWFYLKDLPVHKPPVKPQFEDYSMADALQGMIEKEAGEEENANAGSVLAMNMVFQFLFQELKDTKVVRRYIIRKMTAEFKELLTTKAAGKIIHKITARDFSLGTSFPVIHSLKLESHQMDKARKSIQEITLVMDIEYTNGFSISVDADLILGRSAYVHIKIASIKGKARLQFTRHPFTHWNFAFVDEPVINFAASSHFDGRQIPQLTTLILNQLRRSIKRKHTLPNYKVRFKPFFDPLYAQSLYKSHLDEMLEKEADEEAARLLEETQNAAAAAGETTGAEGGDIKGVGESGETTEPADQEAGTEAAKPIFRNSKLAALGLKTSAKYSSIQYRKLCDKIGFDLTSVGQLVVRLRACDRLPEALLSVVSPQLQAAAAGAAPSAEQTPVTATVAQQQPEAVVYLTVSVDRESMKALMEKQICKEQWPLFDFEFSRSSAAQPLGLVYQEIYFINRNEVFIQRILPNSPAAALVNLKCYDIVHSVNNTRISSIKQLNKLVQKAPVGAPLKFSVQRPCVNREIVDNNANEALSMLPLLKKSASTQSDMASAAAAAAALASSSSSSAGFQSGPGTPAAGAAQPALPAANSSSTRQRFVGRLEQKLKMSFGAGGTATAPAFLAAAATSPAASTADTAESSTRNSLPAAAAEPASGLPSLPPPPAVVVTHTASASWLVDYFCSASESLTSEPLADLDLIALLTNSNRSIKGGGGGASFRRTREIKLQKENLLKYNNVPVQVDETYLFELDESTKYLNVFLWTVQYTAKATRMKNLLIGFSTLPLNEVNVDCWNTAKGETQSTVYFQPVDELKASASGSAISRLVRANVLSDHPGFNSSVSVGALTLNFHHKLTTSTSTSTSASETTSTLVEPSTAAPLRVSASLDSLKTAAETASVAESVSSSELARISDRSLAGVIAQELVEQKELELAYNKLQLETNPQGLGLAGGASGGAGGPSGAGQAADESSHKFVNIQFNESVSCEFCLKKIWFKNAYKCAYCGYTIHIKCLDKTIGKSKCDHVARSRAPAGTQASSSKVTPEPATDDSYLVIATPGAGQVSERPTTPTQQLYSLQTSVDSAGSGSSATPRNLVTTFLSGIRQRRWTGGGQQSATNSGATTPVDAKSLVSTSSKAQSIISNSLSLISKAKNASSASMTSLAEAEARSSKLAGTSSPATSHKSLGNYANSGAGDSSSDVEEFKDVDPSEEKFFGSELYDELPLEERKIKYQETIQKYQSTIEMMTKLKMELERELEAAGRKDEANGAGGSSRNSLVYQERLRSQVKHLEDQMKCVVFLLMQCQIGLESCNEPTTTIVYSPRPAVATANTVEQEQEPDLSEAGDRSTLVPMPTEAPMRPPPPSIFILNEPQDNSDEDFSDTNSNLNPPSATEAEQTEDTSDDALR